MSGGVSWSHTNRSFEDAANTPIIEVAAHDNVDANLTLTTPDEHWQFTLAGFNLTDRVYPIGEFYIAGGYQPRRISGLIQMSLKTTSGQWREVINIQSDKALAVQFVER